MPTLPGKWSRHSSRRPNSYGRLTCVILIRAKLHLLATGLALDRRHEPVETYNLVNNTQFLVDWLSPDPEPRTGVHRYTFLLYKGVASQASVQPFQASTFNRSGFNLAQFTRDAGLQDSYAGAFMNMDSAPPENLIRQSEYRFFKCFCSLFQFQVLHT
jgi:hypothetical protein